MNNIKSIFKGIYKVIILTSKVILYIFSTLSKVLISLRDGFINRLRFSIHLKLMLSYLWTFTLVFSVQAGVVILGLYLSLPEEQFISHINLIKESLVISGLICAGLVLLLARKSSKKLIEPIDQMNYAVKNITIDDLSTRLDISGAKDELKDLAHTFNNMMDKIEYSVELQNQFVSDASHELRTPISVIKGYTDLLDRWGKNNPEVLDESIEAIKNETEQMKSMIEKLLFLARGDKKSSHIEKNEFELNELIEEIYKETKLIAPNHNVVLGENEAIHITADRNLIKEAIRVFVENSVKYTKEGGLIELGLHYEEPYAVITVKDTGLGIAKKDLSRIFDRFYRTDESRNKSSGGAGLGLSIAKWIAEEHKGKLTVTSELGKGSQFNILLLASKEK